MHKIKKYYFYKIVCVNYTGFKTALNVIWSTPLISTVCVGQSVFFLSSRLAQLVVSYSQDDLLWRLEGYSHVLIACTQTPKYSLLLLRWLILCQLHDKWMVFLRHFWQFFSHILTVFACNRYYGCYHVALLHWSTVPQTTLNTDTQPSHIILTPVLVLSSLCWALTRKHLVPIFIYVFELTRPGIDLPLTRRTLLTTRPAQRFQLMPNNHT